MNALLVEFVGTVFFLYVILYTGEPIPIAIALAVAIMFGAPISGGNFNPAVSLMMARAGKLPMNKLLPYIVVQLLGGLVALNLYRHTRK